MFRREPNLYRLLSLSLLWGCLPFHTKTAFRYQRLLADASCAFIPAPQTRHRTCHQRQPNVCLSSVAGGSVSGGEVSLLLGVDKEKDCYYSRCLEANSLDDLLAWLDQSAWKAAQEDLNDPTDEETVHYLNQVCERMRVFRMTDLVYDRGELIEFLERSNNQFCLVLGGKSVGKSLVLKDFVKRLNDEQTPTGKMALYVSCRAKSGKTLAVNMNLALRKASREKNSFFSGSQEFAKKILPRTSSALDTFVTNNVKPFKAIGEAVVAILEASEGDDSDALEVFTSLAEEAGKQPVLVVDEANECLGLAQSQGVEPNLPKTTTAVLKAIVELTKQDKRLTVILASSEHAYPYTLEDNGLNLQDVSSKIFVGEIPPVSMWELLTKATYDETVTLPNGTKIEKGEKIVGMGPNLATLFLSAYGGHYQRMLDAMETFVRMREQYEIGFGLNKLSEEVRCCLANGLCGGKFGVASLLENMAIQGYAMLDSRENANAKMISKKTVGGIVEKGNTIVGLPMDVWKMTKAKYAVVPTSESARLVILEELLIWKAKKEEEAPKKKGWRRLLFWQGS